MLLVNQAVREAAGLSAQWPFTSVMLVMPVFCFYLRVSRVVGSLTDRRCWCWG